MKKAAFVFTVLLVLSGCGGKPAPEYRTDHEPIRKRFPLLGEFEKCCWEGGTSTINSRLSVPGPSAYYMKGYVFLKPEKTAELLSLLSWVAAPAKFEPDFPVNSVNIAGCKWQVSEELNKKLKLEKKHCRAFFYLINEKNLIYFHISWGG